MQFKEPGKSYFWRKKPKRVYNLLWLAEIALSDPADKIWRHLQTTLILMLSKYRYGLMLLTSAVQLKAMLPWRKKACVCVRGHRTQWLSVRIMILTNCCTICSTHGRTKKKRHVVNWSKLNLRQFSPRWHASFMCEFCIQVSLGNLSEMSVDRKSICIYLVFEGTTKIWYKRFVPWHNARFLSV